MSHIIEFEIDIDEKFNFDKTSIISARFTMHNKKTDINAFKL